MSDGSNPVAVNVEPGVGEGGSVEITMVVTVDGGVLTSLEGKRVGESELVSGGWEGEEEPGGLEDETMVGRKDVRSVVVGLGVGEDTKLDKGGKVVIDVGRGVGTVALVGVNVGKNVSSVKEVGEGEENWVGLRIVMEVNGLVTDEDSVTEGDMLELEGGTVKLESEKLFSSSEGVWDVVDRLLELDSVGGLDVGVKEGEEDVELEELGKRVEIDPGSLSERTTKDDEEVRRESVGIGVMVDSGMDDDSTLLVVVVEDGGRELCSEVMGGSVIFEVTLGGELVDGGSDVDGGS